MEEKRGFIRHPICYPLEFEHASKKIQERTHTIDISEGGLQFLSTRIVHNGEMLILKLPVQNKLFKIKAKVEHVEPNTENDKLYNIGVSFCDYSDAFKVKLIEQIYLIDEYRSLRSIQIGREISLREASQEWIKRYAKRFEKLFWGDEHKNGKDNNHQEKGNSNGNTH